MRTNGTSDRARNASAIRQRTKARNRRIGVARDSVCGQVFGKGVVIRRVMQLKRHACRFRGVLIFFWVFHSSRIGPRQSQFFLETVVHVCVFLRAFVYEHGSDVTAQHLYHSFLDVAALGS